MYQAIDIARYIINWYRKNNMPISNLKLQKLLFFVQAECLVDSQLHSACFSDDIEAWKYGPAVPSVYRAFSNYLSGPILSSVEPNILPEGRYKIIIDKVINRYIDYDAWRMVELSHQETVWINAYYQDDNINSIIDKEEIVKNYHSKVLDYE